MLKGRAWNGGKRRCHRQALFAEPRPRGRGRPCTGRFFRRIRISGSIRMSMSISGWIPADAVVKEGHEGCHERRTSRFVQCIIGIEIKVSDPKIVSAKEDADGTVGMVGTVSRSLVLLLAVPAFTMFVLVLFVPDISIPPPAPPATPDALIPSPTTSHSAAEMSPMLMPGRNAAASSNPAAMAMVYNNLCYYLFRASM
eukprot:scaffold78995_cov48-Attheya_sp.AAC.9